LEAQQGIRELEADVAAKDVRIGELEADVAAKDARIRELEQRVAALMEQVAALTKQVATLTEKLGERRPDPRRRRAAARRSGMPIRQEAGSPTGQGLDRPATGSGCLRARRVLSGAAW
jgi:uncharacterized coiled-coil protein SlyX